MVKEGTYIHIESWMRNELDLKGNDLLVYALIYGFSQDGESEFKGGHQYIADWLGTSRQTVINVLKKLTESELLTKIDIPVAQNIHLVHYKANLLAVKKFDRGGQNFLQGQSKNLTGGGQNFLHKNNIDNNTYTINRNDGESKPQEIIDLYNGICVSLPKVMLLSDNRKKAISARLKKYSVDQIKEAFQKAEASAFLKGDNSKNWHADFDWIMKDTNLPKVLEGKYDRKLEEKKEPDKKNRFNNFNQRNYDFAEYEKRLLGL